MDGFVLPIFPEGALAHSVTTCVWIGVMIIGAFNLRFGWVLSGLVVPGYLAPLLFVKPWSAGVVVFEALITYLVAYWFSERGSRAGLWNALFGRDRFFSLVIISVIVRLIFDTWLLPEFAVWLETRHQTSIDFRNNLHSFGLIIICLLANQFWKTGLLRGLIPVAVPIVLTCLVIRFVLMEFTNFSIGNLNFIYEDVAASLMASPKSYMILILAAFIASRMNLHYGWDYNGILIPALLALQWYQPEKILVSFIEAFIILFVARAVMRLPWLAQTNLEGARKLLLFFNISFVYKLIVGWFVLLAGLEVKASDYFGFGYLLTTLIAVKMHDKEIVARLSRATLQTSLTAVLVASVLAWGFSRIDWQQAITRDDQFVVAKQHVEQTWKPLSEILEAETLTFYQHKSVNDINKPLAVEIDRFSYALELLDRYRSARDAKHLQQAAALLDSLNFDLVEHTDWLLLKEREPSFGWGTFVLSQTGGRDLSIQVPAPLESGHLSQIGAHLFELTGADSLALAGNHIRLNQNQDPLSTMDQTSLFHAFHRFTRANDTLQLRGAMAENRRYLGETDAALANLSELRVATDLPEQLDLNHLQDMTGRFVTYFEPPRTINIQRDSAAAGFAELYLTEEAVRRLLYAAIEARRGNQSSAANLVAEVYVQQWLNRHRGLIAAKHGNAYRGLSAAELLYFDEQILAAMLDWRARHAERMRSPQALTDLAALDTAAGIVRHRVQLLIDPDGAAHLTLRPSGQAPIRHSALLILRVDPSDPYLVQVPRPLSEPGTLEFGADLYNSNRARGLVVAGSHFMANVDHSADLLRGQNKNSLFSLASQRLVRNDFNAPLAIVQLRGLGHQPRVSAQADVLLAKRPPAYGETEMSSTAVEQYFTGRGLSVAPVDGSWATWGYENQFVLQSRYLEQSRNKSFWTLWVPKQARLAERFVSSNKQLIAQLTSLGLPPAELNLRQRMLDAAQFATLSQDIEEKIRAYQNSGDVVLLSDLLSTSKYYFEAVIDERSQQVYLLVGNPQQHLAGAFLLHNNSPETGEAFGQRVQGREQLARALPDFVRQRQAWILLERSS